MALTRNLKTNAHDPRPHHLTRYQREMFAELDELKALREQARELCESEEEYTSLVENCERLYAIENPGPLAWIVTWAYEKLYWQKTIDELQTSAAAIDPSLIVAEPSEEDPIDPLQMYGL